MSGSFVFLGVELTFKPFMRSRDEQLAFPGYHNLEEYAMPPSQSIKAYIEVSEWWASWDPNQQLRVPVTTAFGTHFNFVRGGGPYDVLI